MLHLPEENIVHTLRLYQQCHAVPELPNRCEDILANNN